MSYSKIFKDKFYSKLLSPAHPLNPIRDRSSSLEFVFQLLDQKEDNNYFIVETGCMRSDHGQLAFGDDGASTYIFDDFINYYDGEFISVDINSQNVNHAKGMVSSKSKIYCSDSVEFLWNIPKEKKIDLLYLDSYDFEFDNPIPSQLHHINNPQFDSLRSKLIEGGKSAFIKNFMENISAECLHDGYQIVWRL